MPVIRAVSHAFPPHVVSQDEVRQAIDRLFAGKMPGLEPLLRVFDTSGVEARHLMMPLSWYLSAPSREERNRVYLEQGEELAFRAAADVLGRAGWQGWEIDHVIFVSSTGLATPTMDARLINRLGLPSSTTRLPLWGLGCAGGAAGLARARDYCLAHPEARVLLVALECCSLTFMPGDRSRKNLVAAAIFGDGAAAALVAGDETGEGGIRITATASKLFPDSYDLMGWEFAEEGMRLVLSPRLPLAVRELLPDLVDDFLAEEGLSRRDLGFYVTHPGGAKVLEAYREALELPAERLSLAREVLRRYGNISSASVLVVLERWLDERREGGYGLLSAFGPGFSAEMSLLTA